MPAQAIMYLFNNSSESGNAVCAGLSLKKISKTGSTFLGGPKWIVINWGASDVPKSVMRSHIINRPGAVSKAINKRTALEWLEAGGVQTVEWTTSFATAKEWVSNGATVVVRRRLEGYEGQGIQIIKPPQAALLEPAKLFTKFMAVDKEYRVHVVNGKVVAVHRKVIQDGWTGAVDATVRNTANGWVFKRVTQFNPQITAQGIKAVKALGLDFGAVDILWDGTKAYVMEVNTAPGIHEMAWTTAQYIKALKEMINGLQ